MATPGDSNELLGTPGPPRSSGPRRPRGGGRRPSTQRPVYHEPEKQVSRGASEPLQDPHCRCFSQNDRHHPGRWEKQGGQGSTVTQPEGSASQVGPNATKHTNPPPAGARERQEPACRQSAPGRGTGVKVSARCLGLLSPRCRQAPPQGSVAFPAAASSPGRRTQRQPQGESPLPADLRAAQSSTLRALPRSLGPGVVAQRGHRAGRSALASGQNPQPVLLHFGSLAPASTWPLTCFSGSHAGHEACAGSTHRQTAHRRARHAGKRVFSAEDGRQHASPGRDPARRPCSEESLTGGKLKGLCLGSHLPASRKLSPKTLPPVGPYTSDGGCGEPQKGAGGSGALGI